MDFRNHIPPDGGHVMLGVASGRVVRSFEIQVAKAKNGQKNDSAEESILEGRCCTFLARFICGLMRMAAHYEQDQKEPSFNNEESPD